MALQSSGAEGQGKFGPRVECKGVCISSPPGSRTLIGRYEQEILKWFASGCIGMDKNALDLKVETQLDLE